MADMETRTVEGAPARVLRVLHVGLANRGVWPLERCVPAIGFQPAALCDVNPEVLREAQKRTGLSASACYTDIDDAIRNSAVDCAIICAPTQWHVPLSIQAIKAGLPVLVEKGMAPDWASATLLVRTVTERNAKLCVAQNYRYSPVEQAIWKALHHENHPAHPGRVHLILYTQNRVRPIPKTLTYPFSSVWDMSCHHFDNMLFFLGPISELTGFSWGAPWSAYPYDNNTSAHVVFASGAHGHYIHTHDAARSNLEIQIHGERGALVLNAGKLTFNERPLEQFGSRPIIEIEPEHTRSETDLLVDFHRYICDSVEPGISARNNLETMAACEMMARSITDGATCRREQLNT